MSTKSSLILTNDNEHWFEETNKQRYKDGKFEGFDIEIEIDNKNLIEYRLDKDDGLFVTIRGDSHLAKILHEYLKNVDESNIVINSENVKHWLIGRMINYKHITGHDETVEVAEGIFRDLEEYKALTGRLEIL